MFVILYYDVDASRCTKMLKNCRKYLTWVQNSVFEGEISEAQYQELIMHLKKVMAKDSQDSVVVYQFRSMKYSKRITIGCDKKGDTQFL